MVLCSNVRAKRVRLVRVALSAFALVAMMGLSVKYSTVAEAKTPGSTYCFHGTCHRVKTLAETRALVGVDQTLYASHYDDCKNDRYNPCGLTSSGERFHADRPDNTASPIYPDGTTLLVWNPETERALVVRVNNAGPYWGNRKLDLSRAAARKLGFEGKGVAKLKVRVIKAPDKKEARYSRNRTYPAVPGDIGDYDSLDEAQTAMAVALALQASAASPLAPVTAANVFDGKTDSEPLIAEAPELVPPEETKQYAADEGDQPYLRTALMGPMDLVVPQSHWRGRQALPRIASLVSIRRPGRQSVWDGHDLATGTNAEDAAEQRVALASAVEEALKRSAATEPGAEAKGSAIVTASITKADKAKAKAKVADKAEQKQASVKVAALVEPPMPEAKPAEVRAKAKADLEARTIAQAKAKEAEAAEAAKVAAAKRASKQRVASASSKKSYKKRSSQQRVASNSRYRKYEPVAQRSGGYWGGYREGRTAQQLQQANLRASPFSAM